MNFTDYAYVPGLFLLSVVYYIFPRRARWCLLMVVSLLFLASWGPEMLPWALGSALIAWITGRVMQGSYERHADAMAQMNPADRKKRMLMVKLGNRPVLITGILLLLILPLYIRLQRTLADIPLLWHVIRLQTAAARWLYSLPGMNLLPTTVPQDGWYYLMPLGLSFYTLSLIGYLADVYWQKEQAQRNFFRLLGFALYFPKLLQGPISIHRTTGKKLNEGGTFDYQEFCFGWQRIAWGFFKKLIIADRLVIFVNNVFYDGARHEGSEYLLAAIFAAFQMYCDFSGCMDIALGSSQVLGIPLEENFRRPFFSTTAAEFWRRWHITLGGWFRDYVYLPLSTSPLLLQWSGALRQKYGRRAGRMFLPILPLLAVWLLTGIWHGTGMNYMVWGVYWFCIILAGTIFQPELSAIPKKLHINADSQGWQLLRVLRTFGLYVLSRIIILPGNLRTSAMVCKRIVTHFAPWRLYGDTLADLGLDTPNLIAALIGLLILLLISSLQEKGVEIRKSIAQQPIFLRWLLWLTLAGSVLVFGVYGAGYDAASFVYMYF